MNVADARGLAFACQAGCGFCCTASPLVHPTEAPALGPRVVRADDGTLRIPLLGPACSSLGADRRCTHYAERPAVCRLYPYQVHAGRRVQAVVTLACPGIFDQHDAPADAESAEDGARDAAERALAYPGAREMADGARAAFAEFDRRMREWGHDATPDRLRAAFLPHLDALARPDALPRFLHAIADGDLVLGSKPVRAVERLFEVDEAPALDDLVEHAAHEAFEGGDDEVWVEPGTWAWTRPSMVDGKVALRRTRADEAPQTITLDPHEAVTDWSPDASAHLRAYLARLAHRDHTEGAAAWVVDASGYQATLAAAYARVLGEAALQVVARAGLLALEAGASSIDARLARRGIAAYETSYHSLPTIGSIL